MELQFISPRDQKPGTIASLLRQAYADLLISDPLTFRPEHVNWAQYDCDVFEQPTTVGVCIFVTQLDGRIIGFGSWDPRQGPQVGIIGHNCILPEFRGRGFGKQQIREILRRFGVMSIEKAIVSTNDHPFFIPAQRMYLAFGFREVRRIPWDRDPRYWTIEYEMEIGQQAGP
jgi:GNAT superfamily N-acetyltransferase